MALSIWKTARSVRLALAATAMGTYILGLGYVHANGFDACERPSCASKDDILRMMKAAESRAASRVSQSNTSQTQASTTASGEIAPDSAGEPGLKECDCPPDRAELGFHSWQLLHSVAANYPERPNPDEKQACINLFAALGDLYPCKHCAAHLKHSLESNPPRVETRQALSVWVCELHNKVNAFLDKPQFPCDMQALDERWLTGHQQCWQHKMESAQASLGKEDAEAAAE